MTVRYSGQTTTTLAGLQVPLPNVSISVYESQGALVTLTADGGGPLTNPFDSDGQGNFAFNVAATGLYDLIYSVGGKQVFRENGVQVGTGDSALTVFVKNIIGATPLTVTSAAGQSVTSRGLLAGIVAPVNNQAATLMEAGREGIFQFSTANHATHVTSDPYQAIYVAPASDTTGASGAWIRDVPDNIYRLIWWGVTAAAADNQPQLSNFLFGGLVPSGGVRKLPPFAFTTRSTAAVAGIVPETNNVIIEGYGVDISRIVAASDATAFTPLYLYGSHITLRNFGVTGNSDPAFANALPCVNLGGGLTTTVYTNWLVENCAFDGGSIGLICTASNGNTVASGLARPKGIRIRNCRFETKGQGFSLFAAEDVEVSDCKLNMVTSTPDNSNCGFRVLGSKNVHIDNVNGVCSGEYGMYIALMQRGVSDGILRAQNQDVFIRNCDLSNTTEFGAKIEECLGDLEITGCNISRTGAADSNSVAVFINSGTTVAGITSKLQRVKIENNTFQGFHLASQSIGTGGHLRVRGNKFIKPADLPTGGLPGLLYYAQFGAMGLCEFFDNECLQVAADTNGIAANNAAIIALLQNTRNSIIVGKRNLLPEGSAAGGGNDGWCVTSGTGGTVVGTFADQTVLPSGSYAAATA